jgi:hypothetical protein
MYMEGQIWISGEQWNCHRHVCRSMAYDRGEYIEPAMIPSFAHYL